VVTVASRWQRTGLQTRVTLLAGAAVAVALVAGAVLLVTALRAGLTGAVDERALSRVAEVERLVAEGRLPALLPAADPSVLVQVLDREGRVVAATSGTSRVVALLTPAEVDRASSREVAVAISGDRVGYGDALRVHARRTPSGSPACREGRCWQPCRPQRSTTRSGWSGRRWSSACPCCCWPRPAACG
jgi:hypothetical protein